MMAKRSYTRRSDEQLISDLQDKLKRVEARVEARERPDAPVLKEITKVSRTLQRFAQLATDCDRGDLSNMTLAFLSGLERAATDFPIKKPKGRRENISA
ncbi:MAG: hypothetical protein ACI8X5_001555 [Planctomycetota bacterium]|jgi:hypothetical protein